MLGEAGFTAIIDKPPVLGIQLSHLQAISAVSPPPPSTPVEEGQSHQPPHSSKHVIVLLRNPQLPSG